MHSNGVVQTREQFVKTVVQKKEIFRKIDLIDQKVTVTGATAILATNFMRIFCLKGHPCSSS